MMLFARKVSGTPLRRAQGILPRGSRFAAWKIGPSGACLTVRPRLR